MIISRLFSGTFTPMKNNACKTPSNSKVAHLLAVSAVLLFASAALAQNPATFLQTPYYSGGGVVAVADFNGDGKPDIATSSGTLLLGNGDGTFRNGPPIAFPGAPDAIVAADVNQDGKQDLIAWGSTNSMISVLLGNGDGTFQPAINTDVGFSGSWGEGEFAAGNLGNGTVDLVLPSPMGNGIEVFVGNGDGTFKTSVSYSTGTSVPSLILVDVNGDGKLDVVTGGLLVSVLLGNGDGTFKPAQSTPLSGTPVVAADFNNDGKLDLAAVSYSGGEVVGISFGNGDGTFQSPTFVPIEGGGIAAGDFSGSGTADLVVTDGHNVVEVLKNNGGGAFSAGDSYLVDYIAGENGGGDIAIADFNEDQKLDIAVTAWGAVDILLGNGDATFQAMPMYAAPTNYRAVVVGDFNKDGKPDAVALASNAFDVYVGGGNGTLAAPVSYAMPSGFSGSSVIAGDFNGDGNLDVFVSGCCGAGGYTFLGNGDGTFQNPVAETVAESSFEAADLNDDGKSDLAGIVNSENGDSVFVMLSNGDGTFQAPVLYFVGQTPNSSAIGDVNGDGKPDLVATVGDSVAILLGNGDGTFANAYYVFSAGGSRVVIGDFNSDGIPDLALSVAQFEYVLLGIGGGKFGPPIGSVAYFAGPQIPVDINGDGILDLVGMGPYQSASYALGRGDGRFDAPLSIPTPFRNTFGGFAVADFNLDKRPDVVTVGPYVAIALNTTTPGFELSATALSPATVVAGNSATSTVKVTPTFGFNGTVTLSCSGLPSGASCGFNPPSIPNASGTSKLTAATSTTTPAGSYPVKVSGTSGSLVQSTTVTLVVQAAPDFTIGPASGSPTSQTISAGQSAKFSLEVTPSGGFTGTVSLSCAITPSVTPAPTCSLSNSSVQITGSGSQPVTATVETTAPVTTGTVSHVDFPPGAMPLAWAVMWLGSAWLWLRNRRRLPLVAAPLIVLALALWAGCGGGGSSSHTTPGTPAGTYTATVTATSGRLNHNMTLTLVVQ